MPGMRGNHALSGECVIFHNFQCITIVIPIVWRKKHKIYRYIEKYPYALRVEIVEK